MSVLIYRPRLTKNIKRFGRFSKEIKSRLTNKGIIVDVVNDAKKSICLQQMRNHETIIIIGHGDDGVIYHRLHRQMTKKQSLISKYDIVQKNTNVLSAIRGKKIIAIACRTARSLGKCVCEKGGCLAYLGFYSKIHFDKRDHQGIDEVSPEYYHFLLKFYKAVFADVLEMAIENQWTFYKLSIVLEIELQKRIFTAINNEDSIKSPYYKELVFGQAQIAVLNVSQNIKVYGNDQEQVV